MVTTVRQRKRNLTRIRLGQVATPRPVADWMVRWACAANPRRILDPAVGQGVFIDAVEHRLRDNGRGRPPRIDVYDVDPNMLSALAARPHVSRVCCRREDFITARTSGAYDAIIANPPYVRHHELGYGDAVFERFDRLCGQRLSRMTNLYGLFLIKIWSQLAPGGRAAVITPAEWLNADFGRPIKTHLLEQNAIDAIVHFDHAAPVFDDVLTTAAIILLRRGRRRGAPVLILNLPTASALRGADLGRGRRIPPSRLDPNKKWSTLFSAHGASEPGGPPPRHGAGLEDEPRLGDIARCQRGIATGANDFFAMRESERRRFGLELSDLALCITKAHHVAGGILTKAHVRRLVEADARVYLLSPRPRLSPALRRFLDTGRRLAIDRRYLPSHRPVWFRPEHRDPSPILVSVFSRGAFKFVLNRAGVLNLTAFHGIQLRDSSPPRIRALFDFLVSTEGQTRLRDHRRIYADGLSKLEPKDVEAMSIPRKLHESCRPRAAS